MTNFWSLLLGLLCKKNAWKHNKKNNWRGVGIKPSRFEKTIKFNKRVGTIPESRVIFSMDNITHSCIIL